MVMYANGRASVVLKSYKTSLYTTFAVVLYAGITIKYTIGTTLIKRSSSVITNHYIRI